jgi:hypothetical protein
MQFKSCLMRVWKSLCWDDSGPIHQHPPPPPQDQKIIGCYFYQIDFYSPSPNRQDPGRIFAVDVTISSLASNSIYNLLFCKISLSPGTCRRWTQRCRSTRGPPSRWSRTWSGQNRIDWLLISWYYAFKGTAK